MKALSILILSLLISSISARTDDLTLAEGTLDSITIDTIVLRHRDGSRLSITRSELSASESERMSESVGRYVFVHVPFSAIRELPKKRRPAPLKRGPKIDEGAASGKGAQ